MSMAQGDYTCVMHWYDSGQKYKVMYTGNVALPARMSFRSSDRVDLLGSTVHVHQRGGMRLTYAHALYIWGVHVRLRICMHVGKKRIALFICRIYHLLWIASGSKYSRRGW